MPTRRSWLLSNCCAAMALLVAAAVSAQTAPQIECLFPPGAQRGTQVEVIAIGEFYPGAGKFTASGPGVSLVDGKSAADRFTLAIAPDAPLGPCEVRLSVTQGSSAPFPFVVGELPEIVNTTYGKALEVKPPLTVNGRLAVAGDLDEYAVSLAAGQQLVCAAATRNINSPLDPMLRLLDEKGQIVAGSVAHRSADALLLYRAPAAGRYVLQIFDFQMAGSPQHIYRLTLTTGPWIDYAFPAGLAKGAASQVTLFGWNLPSPDGRQMPLAIAPQPAGRYEVSLPGGANRLTLPVDEHPEQLEVEPNDAADKAQTIATPITINGRLGTAGDVDLFAFTAKKGDKLALDVDSAGLRFAADAVLTILTDAGKVVQEVDDFKTSRDPSLRFTAAADGRFLISLRDRSRAGGDDFVYRLHVAPPRPELTARVNTASLTLAAGQSTNLPVIVERVDGLEGDFELTALDLPAGVTVKPQPVPPKTPATIQLPLTVAEKLAPVAGLVRIIVRSTKPDAPLERTALVAATPQATTGSNSLWLAVSPVVPFTLKFTSTILDAPRMAAFPFPVEVVRNEGFAGAIRLVGVEPDKRGTVVPLTGEIAAGSSAGTIPLVIQHQVTEGTTHRSRVMGVAEVPGADGKLYAVFHVAPGAMNMGCEPSQLTLVVDPAFATWKPGETRQINVQLMRRVDMGPVTLKLDPLRGVTGLSCDPVEVAAGQSQAALVLKFTPDAVLPPRATLTIRAESTRAGLPIYGQTSFRLESP